MTRGRDLQDEYLKWCEIIMGENSMATRREKMFHLHDPVSSKDGKTIGKLTRIKAGYGLVMAEGAKEPVKIKLDNLVKIKKGRPAKANAKGAGTTPSPVKRTKETTTRIQIIMRGTMRGPNWKSVARSFDNVLDAYSYLFGMDDKGKRIFNLKDVNDCTASLQPPDEAEITTNYPIPLIESKKVPKTPLPVIITLEAVPRPLLLPPKRVVEAAEKIAATEAAKPKKKGPGPRPEGVVPLKTICAELNVEGREARIALRALAKKGKLSHEPSGRWEWPKEQADDIKAQLAEALKNGVKGEKSATPKRKSAAEAIDSAGKHLRPSEATNAADKASPKTITIKPAVTIPSKKKKFVFKKRK